MKLANISGRPSIVRDDLALDIHAVSGGRLGPSLSVLSDLALYPQLEQLAADAAAEDWKSFSAGELGPVSKPYKAVGIALNYRGHAEESGIPIPDAPAVFAKFGSSVTGPFDDIHVWEGLDRIDFEAEVVVVIGRAGRHIPEAQAWSYVAGITAGQDISDRREQWRKPLNQFTLAKSYDTYSPVGPVLVTVDEFDDPDDIEIIGHVDDLEVQRSRTSDLIFSVPVLISWLSERITFEPGDLIFTGTPAGCGVSRTPRLYLQPGMVVRTEVPGVGVMRNRVTAG